MSQEKGIINQGPESRKAMMEAQDAEIREKLKGFKNKFLVMSGKGGVGKSTIAA